MATDAERIQALRDFFVNSFKAEELGMFLQLNGYGEVVSAVNPNVGSMKYFFDVAQALYHRGLIDAVFFQCLTQERPKLEGDIRVLRESWRLGETTRPTTSDDTNPSGDRESIDAQSPWKHLLLRGKEHVTALLYRRVALGSVAGAGLCLAFAILMLGVALDPPKPTGPPELIPIDATELVDPLDEYEPITPTDRNSEEGLGRLERMRPLALLCSSLHPIPKRVGGKNYPAVVAIRSKPFDGPYRAFNGSTICARLPEDYQPGPDSANEPVCFAFLVTDEKDATVLRSLTVSKVDVKDTPYRRFTYSVPTSRKGDRLFVIIGLPKRSYEFTRDDKKPPSGEGGFAIKAGP